MAKRVPKAEAAQQHKGQLVGYGRTSTSDQLAGLEAQIRDLKAAGCEKVFSEQVSSVAQRAELTRALDYVREGDILAVTRPDRLARSTADLLAIVQGLEAKGVALLVLSMGGQAVDTRTPTGKLMLTMLGAIAAFERDLMLERQREGIAKAKSEGRYKGRAPTAMAKADQVHNLHARSVGATEIAKQLGIGRASVYRILKNVQSVSPSLRQRAKAERFLR
jgi:DNA invertase Pin-like site-specific DNA recombinase